MWEVRTHFCHCDIDSPFASRSPLWSFIRKTVAGVRLAVIIGRRRECSCSITEVLKSIEFLIWPAFSSLVSVLFAVVFFIYLLFLQFSYVFLVLFYFLQKHGLEIDRQILRIGKLWEILCWIVAQPKNVFTFEYVYVCQELREFDWCN